MSLADELRRQIRATHKRTTVNVPGLGEYHVRGLTAAEWAFYADSLEKDKPSDQLERMIQAIIAGTIKEDGGRYFTGSDDEMADVRTTLRDELTREQVEGWFAAIMEVSGVGDDDPKEDSAPRVSSLTG